MSQLKGTKKPLKGINQLNNVGYISATEIIATTISVPGLIAPDGALENVVINNAVITNSQIGVGGNNVGNFTMIQSGVPGVGYNVIFYGFGDDYFLWDPNIPALILEAGLQVRDCSLLGDIRICGNTISSELTDQDINISPNGIGDLNITSGINQRTTIGNFSSISNSASLVASNAINISSSNDSVNLSSRKDTSISTVNGDIIFNTDTGSAVNKFFSSIVQDAPFVVKITTTTPHNYDIGDTITIRNSNSDPLVDGSYIILDIPSRTSFTISAGVTTPGTSGIATRTPSNNVIFNNKVGTKVTIPYQVPLQLGEANSFVGTTGTNSTGVMVLSSGQLFIPFDSTLRFGTIGNIWSSTGGTMTISSGNVLSVDSPTTTVTGTDMFINSTNIRVADPILSLGGTTTSGVLYGNRDRGIEYFYNNNATSGSTVGSKLGWFGVKRSSGRFTFIPDATNNSEIISGVSGDIEANAVYSSNFVINSGGSFDAACGSLINVGQIRGCGGSNGTLALNGDSQVILNGRNGIVLNSTSGILLNGNLVGIPIGVPISFGTSGNTIVSNTSGTALILNAPAIYTSTNTVILNRNSFIGLDGSTNSVQRIGSDSSGNVLVITGTTASITLSTGNVFLPVGSATNYGSSGIITGTSSGQLTVSSSTINLSAGTINVPQNSPVQLGQSSSIVGSSNAMVLTNPTQINLDTPKVIVPQTGSVVLDGTTGANTLTTTSSGTMVLSSSGGSVSISNSAVNIGLQSNSISINNSSVSINATNGSLILNSKTVKISDPIVEIGSGETRAVDRGIEYNYATGGNRFFGFKEDTQRFTVYRSSINNSEVISGTLGDLQVSGIFAQNLNLTTKGTLDLACGAITRVSTISSSEDCGDTLLLTTSTSAGSISIASTGDISISSRSRVRLNESVPIVFGTRGSSIVSSIGTMIISSPSNGSLVLDSQDVQIIDPVVTLGQSNSTNVDRGILFKKGESSGFFGYKNTTGTLVYYQNAIETSTEIIGTLGNLTINQITSGTLTVSGGGISVVSGSVTVTNGGLTTSADIKTNNLTVNGGTISSGTSGNLTLVSSTGNILLNPAGTSGNVILTDSKLTFGTTGDTIITGTGSGTGAALNLVSSTVAIGDSSKLSFGTTSNILNSGGSLVLQNLSGSSGGVYVSAGSLTVPETTPIYFGSPNVNMYSEGDKLYINGYKGTIINGNDITFVGNLNVAGDFSTSTTVDFSSPYIYPLGNYNIVDIANVTQPTVGILEITTSTSNGLTLSDSVTLRNTFSDPRIDEKYIISSIISPTTFRVTTGTVLISGSTTGRIISSLTSDPAKDVGIQVNWHTGNTIGTVASRTGFFGFKRSTERWTFYNTGTNSDDVFSGTLGNIEASKAFLNNISGFVLDGAVSAGSNAIIGTNFQVGGGSIESTPIGTNAPSTGRFTNLTSTVQSNVNNQSIGGRLALSTERFTVQSSLPIINPSSLTIVSFVSVAGVSFDGSGTMPDGSVDGQTKTIIISAMGANCTYTLNFSSGKLVMPNPLNASAIPTKVTFKRKGQSMNLVWDNIGSFWVPTGGNGGYVS